MKSRRNPDGTSEITPMSNRLPDSDPRLKSLCHVGDGENCCRWLARASRGFFCAKLDTDLAPLIEQRFADGSLRARGDHCPGLPRGDESLPEGNDIQYVVVQDTEPTPCPCCRQDAYAWRIAGPFMPENLRAMVFYGEQGQQEAQGIAEALSEGEMVGNVAT